MIFKPTPVGAAIAVLMGSLSASAQAELVITEYIEGSSSNKAVEISNLGSAAINLDANQYKIALFSNGSVDEGNTEILTGTLQPGQSLVYHNSSAAPEFQVGTASTITYFNGDDALVLTKDGVVIDRFGKRGDDPGSAWTDPNDPNFSTANKTLRRKASVTSGDTTPEADFPGADNQWVVFDTDTADGLGCPGEGTCGEAPGVLLITEYVEGSSNNKAVELSNVGASAIDLDAAEYKLALYGNGSVEEGNSEILTGTLAPGESIVFHNSSAAPEFQVGTASTVTYFNGDDALVLTKDGVVIDRFGTRGEDPGSAWTDPNDPNFSTANKTLRRKASVTAGDTNAEAPFPGDDNQWLVFDTDTADGLGCSGESACGEPEPDPAPCTGCEVLDKVADASTFNPDEYYSTILNGEFASADAMKDALSGVIQTGHKALTYKGVWTVLTYSDEDPSNPNNVIELYSGTSISKFDNGGNQGDWNREHVWPKSHGFPSESQWGYTDAHHLRPTDVSVNSTRSNYDFDLSSETGSEVSGAPGNYVDGTRGTFEPRDAVKGDVARIMFYMDTRYQGAEGDGSMPDLVLVDAIGTDGSEAGKLCTLYQWHIDDPVDDADRQRNDAVYEYQGNRNPYIDYPEWVKTVYGAQCGDAPLPELDVEVIIDAPAKVDEGGAFTLDASATVGGEGQVLTFSWAQVAGPEVSFSAEGAVLNAVAPVVDADTPLQFELTVSDGTLETTEAVSLTVTNVPFTVDVAFAGPESVMEGEAVAISATVENAPEGQTLSYRWEQRSGTPAEFTADGLALTLTAPDVTMDQQLEFALIVSNGHDDVEAMHSFRVLNDQAPGWTEPDGAGALGGLGLLLLPLVWRRRRQA
ncbi:endonuclease [Marinobacter hydrocarbonoclasticus]|nr:endonuclease [Marinobacter nauticus]